MHANICWQSIACIVCKEINLWLRYGWCGHEDGLLLLLLIVGEVVAALVACPSPPWLVTRVNSTNVLNEGLRIGEIGRRMNSKVKSVKQGVCRK
jgi:hypothetical protein